MGQTFASLFCLLFGLAALARGASILAGLQSSATLLQASYEQEYQLRQCGAKAAAAANLGDSARYIGWRHPSKQAAANRAAEELVAMLGGARGLPSDAPTCFTEGLWPMGISLHRQQHRDQDSSLPNWIARFVRWHP